MFTATPAGLSGRWRSLPPEDGPVKPMVGVWSESVRYAVVKPPNSSKMFDGRHPRAVEMPPVTRGRCRIHRCWVVGDLASGLCVTHWDRGMDKYGYGKEDNEDKEDKSAVE